MKNVYIIGGSPKQWKKDGSIVETMIDSISGKDLPIKNNIRKWLEKLRYRYVPAIKGAEYFTSLMGELHDVLNSAHEEILKNQGQGFITGIQKITEDITSELNQQIGIPNTIQVPSDFRLLFSNLDFGSKLGGNTYHLKQRGDGIKVRHVPVILKYMSEQERNISVPGFVKPDTIWGFEEPENNLELKYAFDLAESFKKYSKDIQIFLTTHSPAFYALDKSETDNVKTFFVSQDVSGCTNLKAINNSDTDEIHEKMGLLPLITPYLTQVIEKQTEIENQKKIIESLQDNIKCLVLTEDQNSDNIKVIFSSSGFNLNETDFISYNGAGNLNAVKVIAKHYLSKKPHLKIVIHRDRDYLEDEIIDHQKKEIEHIKCHFYTTSGVDVESAFLNSSHINCLYPQITVETIKEMVFEATNQAEQDSIDRFIDRTFSVEKPENNGYAKKIGKIKALYLSDTNRYRYGKKVLNLVGSKIQKLLKSNPILIKHSDHIFDPALAEIAKTIWIVHDD